LGDVASALPKALALDGHDVTLIIPNYSQVRARMKEAPPVIPVPGTLRVPVGHKSVDTHFFKSNLPGSNVTVYLIDQPAYFDRRELYTENDQDYRDNCERFVFFSRAVIELVKYLDLRPEIIHSNDWQTGLIPALVSIELRRLPGFHRTATIFTIHNMAFQGRFWHWDMNLTGLDWKHFNWKEMEFFGHLNLLKTGIVFSDILTTVSPTYAREIQTPDFGCGLHAVLGIRSRDLVGILNGVDTEIWNPSTDMFLAQRYSADTVTVGKPVCKAALQKRLGLPQRPDVPVFGSVSRMTGQKGFSLIGQCASMLIELDIQIVFLGSGDPAYEEMLNKLANNHPEKVSTTIGYSEELAHQIEAGCDAYLMPSEFEPCGLNQMYSLIYGTVPIVRAVGGLADSVVDATNQNISAGAANGFSFHEFRSEVLFWNICRARKMFADPIVWRALQQTGMRHDWSWKRSATQYVQAYERALARRRFEPECAGDER